MSAVLIGAQPFDETLAFFVDELDFALELITPADDPSLAVVQRGDLRLHLDRTVPASAVVLLLDGDGDERTAPNGAVVRFETPRRLHVPDLVPELVVAELDESDAGAWGIGRAGMRYRDLIPSRLGGRFIASHIEVCDGGPVPDRVHHHDIRFQLIVCQRGWVDVVYEDQGPAFRLEAGDAVTQPPGIRHRVLASSAGARVVEIGCPADHDTLFDDALELPTGRVDAARLWGGQRFVRHQGASAPWRDDPREGFAAFQQQDTGVARATDGLAGVRMLAPRADATTSVATSHAGEFCFYFVLAGHAELEIGGQRRHLTEGGAVTIPEATPWRWSEPSANLRLLEVTLPG